MKDIKSLYKAAKEKSSDANIYAYKEAIDYLIENNPYEYASNLEYIISSSIGVKSLKSFEEKNGLPIPIFYNAISILENTIQKCKDRNLDYNSFKEVYNEMVDYHEKYLECFNMFEYYDEGYNDNYIKLYYEKNDKNIQGRKLASGLIKEFKEYAIPDTLISSINISHKVNEKVVNFILENYKNNLTMCEWLLMVENKLNDQLSKETFDVLKESSLSNQINNIINAHKDAFRESAIMGVENDFELTESGMNKVKELISFKEYQFYSLDNFYSENAIKLKNEISDLYNFLSEYAFEESDADIIPMLPQNNIKEATWLSNSHDKKDGSAPGYLKQNHDMASYGEDDGKPKSSDENDDIDQYRRPSSSKPNKDLFNIEDDEDSDSGSSSNINNDYDKDDSDEDNDVNKSSSSDKSPVTNYYYYNYHNSLNKNTNSFNKDNSTHDNHSTKNINSHNTSSVNKEAWELNIFGDDYFQEASHGNLKYDYRMGWDYDTGHMIKVVYSLDNIEVTDIGDFYINNRGKKVGATHDSHLDYTRKNIHKKGNTDHQSKGQKVLAIIDTVTNKRLDSVKLLNPLIPGIKTTSNTIPNLENIRKIADNNSNNFIHKIKVGEIYNEARYKTTHWATNIIDKKTGENLRFNHIVQSEMKKDGRGWKVNNINAKHFKVYGDNNRYMTYHNPNKQQALNELRIREANIVNFLNDFMKRFKTEYEFYNNETVKNQINNLKIIKYDINTIQNGKYDLNIMKKYREYDEAVNAGLTENQTWDYETYMLYQPTMEKIENDDRFNNNKLFYNESVGDADDDKPESDHPIKDTLTDLDRELTKHQQNIKKKVQDVQNVGRAAIKPVKRTTQWVNNMVHQWKDADETKAKEKLADPHARKNVFEAIKTAIAAGSLFKAGILLNPLFLFLAVTKKLTSKNKEFRLRNEMIGEIKAEIEIVEEKIKDAEYNRDNRAKYQLMRFKNELNKKLLRVGGGKQWAKII